MKEIEVEKAIGTVLAHDVTQILPGEYKGPRFKKGHVIKEEDIPVLLSMGKQHLYVVEKEDQDIHEDEAALRIAKAACGSGVTLKGPSEGKVEIFADIDGLLKINVDLLGHLIEQDDIMFASIKENQLVKKGDKLAGTRVIPLFVNPGVVEAAEKTLEEGTLIQVKPLKKMKVGLVTTGSEVYSGRIEDKFGPVLDKKFKDLGSEVFKQYFADDDVKMISEKIKLLIEEGAEIIGVTGGMSVDPDDRTPSGIRAAGGHIVIYGAPVLPGAMFMLAYIDNVPVVGLPGCVMYSRTSIFDLIVPRLLAGEHVTRGDVKRLAHGGLCMDCEVCTYPKCGFGK